MQGTSQDCIILTLLKIKLESNVYAIEVPVASLNPNPS